MRKVRIPRYCLHKATGQARVSFNGRDQYLGLYDSPESHRRYREIVETIKRQSLTPAKSGLDIASLSLLYLDHCRQYYVKDGRETSEVSSIKAALKPLLKHYRRLLITEFSPSKLRHIQEVLAKSGNNRLTCNKHIGRIVRMVRWAVSMENCPVEVLSCLETVPGLRAGRSIAHESGPVLPVSVPDVMAIEQVIGRNLWGAVRFQLLTAARPGEALRVRERDLDRSGDVWIYRPDGHKTEHHGKERLILVGPKAQAVLTEFLTDNPDDYLFAVPRSNGNKHYLTHSYTVAIRKACKKAGIAVWRANQLRHTAATEIRRSANVETAKTVLGHSELRITEVYAQRDLVDAMSIISRIG